MIMVNVMYPDGEGATFDYDYYLSTHVKLVRDRWTPTGLKSVKIAKGLSGGDPAAPAPYLTIASLIFDSVEDFQKSAAAHGKEIFADIANFTNTKPEVQISELIE